MACFEHSNFFKVTGSSAIPAQRRAEILLELKNRPVGTHSRSGPTDPSRNSTTSFLTATALIYAIGAGITAAAGTRLALQWILVKDFKLYSFQLQDF